MRTLSATLLTAQQSSVERPLVRLTFSKPAETNVVIEQDKILSIPTQVETPDSQKMTVVFDNSTGYFTTLDLKGWTVVPEWGLWTSVGAEYSALPPMRVISSDLSSTPGRLACTMGFIGIPNLLTEDKASKDYSNHWSNTKTVKDLITEILSGVAVDTELTASQEVIAAPPVFWPIYNSTYTYVGQRVSMPDRTITKIAFLMKKVGGPPGTNVAFTIYDATSPYSQLATVNFPIASITTSPTWCEATLASPVLINKPMTYDTHRSAVGGVWVTAAYSSGDASNYIAVQYNNLAVKSGEWMVAQQVNEAANAGWENSEMDCCYRYKYTNGTASQNGVDCFTHCTAYTPVYDSLDSLIDTYLPANGFGIREGSSRLDAINNLLRFTTCVMRVEADGNPHVFAPPVNYSLTEDKILYEYLITGDAGTGTAKGVNWLAQTFTPISSHTIGSVKTLMFRIGAPGTVTIGIRATDINGHPTGSNLCSGTTDGNTLTTSAAGEWRKITFGAGAALTTGTKYAIVVSDPTGDSNNSVNLRYRVGGYANGNYEHSADSGVTWSSSATVTFDFMFEEYSIYDSEYALGSGNHAFFAKSIRNALVIPNKVTVHSNPDDAIQASGSFTDTTSYALLPMEQFVRATLTSGAQAIAIATAMIAQNVMNGQRGSATVPLNLGAEVYDYVLVTDIRENDSRTGNIGYLHRQYRPGRTFGMGFSFGKRDFAALAYPHLPHYLLPVVQESKSQVATLAEDIAISTGIKEAVNAEWQRTVTKKILELDTKAESVQKDVDNTTTQIDTKLLPYARILKDEKTPELGGDLNANSHKVTALTDPTAAQDAATKNYVDTKYVAAVGANYLAYRALYISGTANIYQNTSGKVFLVVASAALGANHIVQAIVDASTALTATVGLMSNAVAGTASITIPITFMVPDASYYILKQVAGTSTLIDWHETTLG